jgi:Domain of unknown function (DUF4926)
MDSLLYSDVILLQDLPEEGLHIGDIGTVVEVHNVVGLETGYSVEFFDMTGNTVGLVTLPMSHFRLPASTDRPAVRLMDSVA